MQQSRKKSYSMCLLHKISKKKFLILMGFSQLELEIEQCSISLNELQNKLYSFRYLIATFSISNVLFHLVFIHVRRNFSSRHCIFFPKFLPIFPVYLYW